MPARPQKFELSEGPPGPGRLRLDRRSGRGSDTGVYRPMFDPSHGQPRPVRVRDLAYQRLLMMPPGHMEFYVIPPLLPTDGALHAGPDLDQCDRV